MEELKSGPRIVEAFKAYTPPFNATNAVRRMLSSVPPRFFLGLYAIVLTNTAALSREDLDRKTWGSQRVALAKTLGYYSPAWEAEPARITLLVDNIEKSWGGFWLRVGIVRDAMLSETLFHELGHHILRVHWPEYKGKEDVADRWSVKLSGKFKRDRYRYLFPIAVPIFLAVGIERDFARIYHRIRN
jgi:hypothetical protein